MGTVRVTAPCGRGWTGPRETWRQWFGEQHAQVHPPGAWCCGAIKITEAETEREAGA